MAQCIACGLHVVGGKLEVQLRPGGGIACDNSGDGNDGLYVTFGDSSGAAAAAMTAANEADDTADAAQNSANAANDSAAYRARLLGAHVNQAPINTGPAGENTPLLIQGGSVEMGTNSFGDVQIIFPQPFPNACISITGSPGHAGYDKILAFHDTGDRFQISVRVYRTDSSIVVGEGIRISYIAIGY